MYVGEDKNDTKFETPVQKTPVLLEKDKVNTLVAECKCNPVKNYIGMYIYSEGFIHAFTDASEAESMAYRANMQRARWGIRKPFHIYRVFECIIPRFTRYGYDKENTHICARKMIVKERIC